MINHYILQTTSPYHTITNTFASYFILFCSLFRFCFWSSSLFLSICSWCHVHKHPDCFFVFFLLFPVQLRQGGLITQGWKDILSKIYSSKNYNYFSKNRQIKNINVQKNYLSKSSLFKNYINMKYIAAISANKLLYRQCPQLNETKNVELKKCFCASALVKWRQIVWNGKNIKHCL